MLRPSGAGPFIGSAWRVKRPHRRSTINARTLQAANAGPLLEVPAPVLFNTWKHHADALRWRIQEAVGAGPAGLDRLAGQVVVLGTKLMDLYTGRLWPAEVCGRILARLRADARLDLPAYREWVAGEGGYRVLTFPEDDSRWVLRVGDEADRYVHLHPGRWSPATLRVRANVLKTAALVLAYTGVHGGDPTGRALVNAVRRDYLGLSPVGKDLEDEQGLGRVIDLLRGRHE
jgi:hypothetical protein